MRKRRKKRKRRKVYYFDAMTAGSSAPAPLGLPYQVRGRQVKYWKQLRPFRSDDQGAEAPFIPIYKEYSKQSWSYILNRELWEIEKTARKIISKILRLKK